jgi:predicted O-methyltransferase YrrM
MAQTINTMKKVFRDEGLGSLIKKSFINIKQICSMPYYIIKLKIKKQMSIEDSLEQAYNSAAHILRPAQVRGEIDYVLNKINARNPKRVMELGTGKGGNLFLLSNVAASDATIISLDMRGGPHGAGYPPWKIPLLKSFVHGDQQLILIDADSHNSNTPSMISRFLQGELLDVLFIDGDHSYEGVKKDFGLYQSFVRPGGLIIMHDIAVCNFDPTCKVNVFWDEIKNNYEYEEVIEDRKQDWGGIGILTQ